MLPILAPNLGSFSRCRGLTLFPQLSHVGDICLPLGLRCAPTAGMSSKMCLCGQYPAAPFLLFTSSSSPGILRLPNAEPLLYFDRHDLLFHPLLHPRLILPLTPLPAPTLGPPPQKPTLPSCFSLFHSYTSQPSSLPRPLVFLDSLPNVISPSPHLSPLIKSSPLLSASPFLQGCIPPLMKPAK